MWHDQQPMYDVGNHTDYWRSLTDHVGDMIAYWMGRWCDAQEDPKLAVETLITVGDMAFSSYRERGGRFEKSSSVKDAMWAFIRRSEEERCST